MTDHPIAEIVEQEIERLHRFLEEWLNGTLPKSDEAFTQGLESRLHPSFVNIQPAGIALTRDDLLGQIRRGWGRSPDFRIRIRSVTLHPPSDETGVLLATYEEYQRGARASARSENARLSSALFVADVANPITWLHIHETLLPEAKHDPALFAF